MPQISVLIQELTDAYNKYGDLEYAVYNSSPEKEHEVTSTEVNTDDPEEPVFFFNI